MFTRHTIGTRFFAGILLLILCGLALHTWAARSSGGSGGSPKAGVLQVGSDQSTFIRIPNAYDPGRPSPLIIVLHGTVDIGNVYYNMYCDLVERDGSDPWKRTIVVAPMAPTDNWHAAKYARRVRAHIDRVRKTVCRKYNIDLGRIVIAGWSTGAVAIGGLVMHRPNTYMAAVMQEGGGYWGPRLRGNARFKTAHRFVIGSKDFMLPQTKRHRTALKRAGYPVSWVLGNGLAHGGARFLAARETWSWIKRRRPTP